MPTPLETAIAAAEPTCGLLNRRGLLAAGVPDTAIRRALAAGELVGVARAVYATTRLPALPTWLVTAGGLSPAAVLHARARLMSWHRSAARRRTAALLRGWGLLVEPKKVEVAVPHGLSRRSSKAVLVQQLRHYSVEQVVPVTGGAPIPMVPAWHAVLDALLSLPAMQAVVLADSALRAGDVTLEELHEHAAALPGTRQAKHARKLLAWCDPKSGSVLESVLRYRMREAGMEGFETQVQLGTVLRADFCFAAARLVVETDGTRWHDDPDKDRLTDNQLCVAGWRVLRFTWAEVVNDHKEVLTQIRAALRAMPMAA